MNWRMKEGKNKLLLWNWIQGFPNSCKEWGEGIENFTGGLFYQGDFFYRMKRAWGGVILKIQTFSETKNSFLWILNISYAVNS